MLFRLLLTVVPALGTFVQARAVLWLGSLGTDASVWEVATWERWDSGHYLSIAGKGTSGYGAR